VSNVLDRKFAEDVLVCSEATAQHLPPGNEENYKYSQESQCPGRYSNWGRPERLKDHHLNQHDR